jgi:hypothetical protein
MGVGTAIIMNLSNSQAKAYNVIPSQHVPGTYVAMNIALPDYVMESINGYNQLKAAFDSYAEVSANSVQDSLFNQFKESVGVYSTSSANGCGSPNFPWSYALIPDFPFREACNMHDICYTTTRSKASCDGEFLYNMQQRIAQIKQDSPDWVWWVSPAGMLLFNIVMEEQADFYHFIVVTRESVRLVYCENTQVVAAPECRPRRPDTGGTYEGTQTSQIAGGGATLTQTCELWSFPAGPDNPGKLYFMLKNCTFS